MEIVKIWSLSERYFKAVVRIVFKEIPPLSSTIDLIIFFRPFFCILIAFTRYIFCLPKDISLHSSNIQHVVSACMNICLPFFLKGQRWLEMFYYQLSMLENCSVVAFWYHKLIFSLMILTCIVVLRVGTGQKCYTCWIDSTRVSRKYYINFKHIWLSKLLVSGVTKLPQKKFSHQILGYDSKRRKSLYPNFAFLTSLKHLQVLHRQKKSYQSTDPQSIRYPTQFQ